MQPETGVTPPIRCPACGGLNPASADWCGQCFKRFTAPAPPPPVAPAVGVEAAPPAPVDLAGTDPLSDPVSQLVVDPNAPPKVLSQRGAFKATDQGIMWTCKQCDTENSIDDMVCSVCGATFAETVRPPGKERPQRDPGAVALASLFMPGAGHAMLGLWGQAIARAILSFWVVSVVFLTGFSGGGRFLIILFGLAATALWAVAAHDAYQEAKNSPRAVILQGRRFLFAVLGLLVVMIIGIIVAALGGPPGTLDSVPGEEL